MLAFLRLVAALLFALSGLPEAVAAPIVVPGSPSSPPPSSGEGAPAKAEGTVALQRLGGRFLVKGRAPSWSPEGTRVAFDDGRAVKVLDRKTDQLSTLAEPGKAPVWSPGAGRHLAFCRGDASRTQVWLVETAGEEPRQLVDGGCPSWSADGKRLFFQAPGETELRSVRVDAPDVPATDLLRVSASYPTVSPSANRVAFWSGNQLLVVDRESEKTLCRWPLARRADGCPAWSPDEGQLAFGGQGIDGVPGLWILDVKRKQAVRIAAGECPQAAWSFDGSMLAFDRRQDTGPEIWTLRTEGLETLEPWAMACEGSTVPEAAAELVGRLHRPQGQMLYVDLKQHANRELSESTGTVEGNHLGELAEGKQTLAGVGFQIGKSIIQLAGTRLPEAPRSVEGIAVDSRAIRLYFLHATQWAGKQFGVPEGTTIGQYRVHYADGASIEIPIVCGREVHDWWARAGERVTHSQVVWVGRNPATESRSRYLRLFLTVWENPHPERTVAKIDYASAMTEAAPFCVAVTVEGPVPLGARRARR